MYFWYYVNGGGGGTHILHIFLMCMWVCVEVFDFKMTKVQDIRNMGTWSGVQVSRYCLCTSRNFLEIKGHRECEADEYLKHDCSDSSWQESIAEQWNETYTSFNLHNYRADESMINQIASRSLELRVYSVQQHDRFHLKKHMQENVFI